jgi:hypothetical protein
MKTNHASSPITTAGAEASAVRYQIYRQNRAGKFLPGYRSDSAPEGVEAFLSQSPAFDGGGVRLLDLREERLVASVEWRKEKTDFGFPVYLRVNRFYDGAIEHLAGEVLARESLRLELRREARLRLSV